MSRKEMSIPKLVETIKRVGLIVGDIVRTNGFLAIHRNRNNEPSLMYLAVGSYYGCVVQLNSSGVPHTKGNLDIHVGSNGDITTLIRAVKDFNLEGCSLSTPLYFNLDPKVKISYYDTVEANKIIDNILLGLIPAEAYLPLAYDYNKTCVVVLLEGEYLYYFIERGEICNISSLLHIPHNSEFNLTMIYV